MDTSYIGGATSKIVTVKAWVISTGLPYTAGVYNTSGLVVHYTRDGATISTITQVTATAGTYTSSGFVYRGDGVYEIGAPTAALAAGADGVEFSCSGITDVVFSTTRVELLGTDPRSSALPDVNVSKINSQTASAAGTVTFPGTVASTTNITAATGVVLSAAGVQAIWDALTSALTTVGSIGKWIVDKLDVVVSTRLATSGYTAPLDAAATRTAVGLASANLDTQLTAIPTAVQNADALLARNQKGGATSSPTVSAALAGGLMLIDIAAGTLTVKNGDGTTAYTRTLTRTALDAITDSV
jgi:hypothetical protein